MIGVPKAGLAPVMVPLAETQNWREGVFPDSAVRTERCSSIDLSLTPLSSTLTWQLTLMYVATQRGERLYEGALWHRRPFITTNRTVKTGHLHSRVSGVKFNEALGYPTLPAEMGYV